MKQNETNLVPKSSEKYECTFCHYKTCRQSQLNRHNLTVKHKLRLNETFETNIGTKSTKMFQCTCGIDFNSRTTLWRHKQICSKENKNSEESLIQYLINENKELKHMIMNVCKQVQPSNLDNKINNNVNNNVNNNINNNIINSNNKTFNLQFFLNETCKDAMNISDFIDSVKLQVSDLENVGKVGYIEGISNIIIKNLEALEV
jgi:hypothetical protein